MVKTSIQARLPQWSNTLTLQDLLSVCSSPQHLEGVSPVACTASCIVAVMEDEVPVDTGIKRRNGPVESMDIGQQHAINRLVSGLVVTIRSTHIVVEHIPQLIVPAGQFCR